MTMTKNETPAEKEARLYAAVAAKIQAKSDESLLFEAKWYARDPSSHRGRNQKRWMQAVTEEMESRGLAI